MFTTCSMASLAPGMSGFVAELMVFCGLFNSTYSPTFKVMVVFLMAVGVI